MIKIGLISDTHGFFDPLLNEYFAECHEIWHAGDIGNISTANEIKLFKPFRAVFGNIDDQNIRNIYPEYLSFTCEGLDVFIIHIGGYPGKYESGIKEKILSYSPDLFISGHSHILKIMPDKKLGLLHINPGAAGKTGFHYIRTAVRFIIDDKKIRDVEVIELGKR